MRPIVLITPGDPAGIGAEVSVRAALSPQVLESMIPVFVGDRDVLEDAVKLTGQEARVIAVRDPAEARGDEGALYVLDQGAVRRGQYEYGRVSEICGRASYRYVLRAIELLKGMYADAVATAPVNKEALRLARCPFPGHTEIFAHETGTDEYAMLLKCGAMRVIHVTTHVPLREACGLITKERVYAAIRLAERALAEEGIAKPRIAVAGLNPHASENGLFGSEEAQAILPAVEQARDEGIDARGPFPPDSVFVRMAAGEFDITVAMYHDQGHIPMKVLGFSLGEKASVRGINTTVGLPVIRTSVDHGTAFDRAGKNVSDDGSMKDALLLAADMARGRAGRACVLADDYTGALDTAARFSEQGIPACAVRGMPDARQVPPGTRVLACDIETRHMGAEDAYRAVRKAVSQARRLGFGTLYVKTDSGMRGRIGAYLRAARDEAGGAPLAFVPSWPEEGRTLEDGVVLIGGVPAAQSAYGQDPLDPVTESRLDRILGMPVRYVKDPGREDLSKRELYAFECARPGAVDEIADALKANGRFRLFAGCAGFARAIPRICGMPRSQPETAPKPKGLFVLSGSLADRNARQLEAGSVPVFGEGDPPQAAARELAGGGCAVYAWARTRAEARRKREGDPGAESAARAFRDVLRAVRESGFSGAYAAFGGDTLACLAQEMGVRWIRPLRQAAPGVVEALAGTDGGAFTLYTKSGNLGPDDVMERLLELCGKEEDETCGTCT